MSSDKDGSRFSNAENLDIKTNQPDIWQGNKIGCNPILGLETIRNTMNELVVDIFCQVGKTPLKLPWQPDINMFSEGDNLYVEMGLPGTGKECLQIHATSELLIVQGIAGSSDEICHGQYYIRERRTGSFSRSIPLPFQIYPDKVAAQLKNGLLTITLPIKLDKPTSGIKIEIE